MVQLIIKFSGGGYSMSAIFPSEEWLKELEEKLNSDEKYGEIAKNWEGDLFFNIEPEGNLKEPLTSYSGPLAWYMPKGGI